MTDDTPSNPFADLQAVASMGGEQRPALRRFGPMWSFPGAPLEGENLRLPRNGVTDLRVRAALAAKAWAVSETDAEGKPLTVVPADAAPASVATPLDHGTVGVMTEGQILPDGSFAATQSEAIQ